MSQFDIFALISLKIFHSYQLQYLIASKYSRKSFHGDEVFREISKTFHHKTKVIIYGLVAITSNVTVQVQVKTNPVYTSNSVI